MGPVTDYDEYLAQVADLYSTGNSLREISRTVNLSKTKVRDLVLRAGVSLRSMLNEKGELVVGTRGKRNVKPPYGFVCFEGRVVKHPKEYPVLLSIINRWKSDQSLNSIATKLNEKRVPSPMVVSFIIAAAIAGELETIQRWVWILQAELLYHCRASNWGSPSIFEGRY